MSKKKYIEPTYIFVPKKVGYVYYANSKKIDNSDYRDRKRYVVVKDNGFFVGVAKIRGYSNNSANDSRLYLLDISKYPLNKKSGVDKKVYTTKAGKSKKLSLYDRSVFDKESDFKLSSKDTHRVLNHVKNRNGKKHKKKG